MNIQLLFSGQWEKINCKYHHNNKNDSFCILFQSLTVYDTQVLNKYWLTEWISTKHFHVYHFMRCFQHHWETHRTGIIFYIFITIFLHFIDNWGLGGEKDSASNYCKQISNSSLRTPKCTLFLAKKASVLWLHIFASLLLRCWEQNTHREWGTKTMP